MAFSGSGGAHSGATEFSPELRAVVEAWPFFNELEQQTILQMVQASNARRNMD